ncbi:MAG: winged helix-turn-helix domain-containing protein, partial [Planctomycetes bacterium]|nr:winged helix-turn-helix domain-containing protein [Planctomycetota bacterium]
LKLLREAHGAVITRDEILDHVWGEEAEPTPRTIDNFIVRLRKKFETDAASPKHILTVRGKGYRLN